MKWIGITLSVFLTDCATSVSHTTQQVDSGGMKKYANIKAGVDLILLALADINHEREYALCHALAEHLLGAVPEPDDIDMEEANL